MTYDDLAMAMMETKLIDQCLEIYPCWSGGYDSKQWSKMTRLSN